MSESDQLSTSSAGETAIHRTRPRGETEEVESRKGRRSRRNVSYAHQEDENQDDEDMENAEENDEDDEEQDEEEEEELIPQRRSSRSRRSVSSYADNDIVEDLTESPRKSPRTGRSRRSASTTSTSSSNASSNNRKRRRSERARSRKTSQKVSTSSETEDDDDDDDEDEIEEAMEEEDEEDDDSEISTRRKRRQARPSKSQSKKKTPQEKKQRQPKRNRTKIIEINDDDDDAFLLDDDEDDATGNDEDDDEEENAFVVDKILARESHTLKEWKRVCEHMNTRFLHHGSIFLDEDDRPKKDMQEISTKNQQDKKDKGDNDDDEGEDEDEGVEVVEGEERFLVKWKNLSYLHVSWETKKALIDYEPNAKGKIMRFLEKEEFNGNDAAGGGGGGRYVQGDEYFNTEFCIVDRILDVRDQPQDDYFDGDEEEEDDKETDEEEEEEEDDEEEEESDSKGSKPTKKFKYFLVKWKAQPYDMITWEREDDVDDDEAVKTYYERIDLAHIRYQHLRTLKKKKTRKGTSFRGYTAEKPPPFKKGQHFTLRDYQLTGVNWLLLNWYHQRNSMLADEMGLGKTVQTVTYVNHLSAVEKLSGPYLIIAPLSTLAHWQREFTNWTNLNAIVYHGSADARKAIQQYEFFLQDEEVDKFKSWKSQENKNIDTSSTTLSTNKSKGRNNKKQKRGKKHQTVHQFRREAIEKGEFRFDVLITTYEMCCATDFMTLAKIPWQLMVVDEAHRLKNRQSKLSTILHKNFKYENCLLLTGTPLQNNVEELWTLLNFLDVDKFDSKEEFIEQYGELKESEQVEKLHGELKPFLLRRMKEDVEKSLAPKEETIVEIELTVLQKQYYRAIYEKNTEFLARGGKKAHAPSLMNVVMELRKVCNHPFLIKGMEERECERLLTQNGGSIQEQVQELLVTSSGKLILLDKLLPRLQENGHRVLIFSQFKIMLDILQDYLRYRGFIAERIDGSITGNERQAAIDRFCDPKSKAFVMLLSTRAGGVGINLTAADTVIIYDSDWNPQNDLQAQARCHRIGQTKSVKIYRLLTSKTYEFHMFHQASMKLGLDQAILGGIRTQNALAIMPTSNTETGKKKNSGNPQQKDQLSKEEIENLLKYGAYEMFKEEKEGEAEAKSKKFSEESIDQILSRSTTIIHDPSKKKNQEEEEKEEQEEAKTKGSLMSSFSKATFVSSNNPDEEVDINDPDFWTKVIGLEEPVPTAASMGIILSPLKKRKCRKDAVSYNEDQSDDDANSKAKKQKKTKAGSGNDNGNGNDTNEKNEDGTDKVPGADEEEWKADDDASESDEEEEDDDDFERIVDPTDKKTSKNKEKTKKDPPAPQAKQQKSLFLTKGAMTRVKDGLGRFGVNRWEDLRKRDPILQKFSIQEVKTFATHIFANGIRCAAQAFVAECQSKDPNMQAEFAINAFARRYLCVANLLQQNKNLKEITEVVVDPSVRPPVNITPPQQMHLLREWERRLQQMEKMTQLEGIIRHRLAPATPLVLVINGLQKLQQNQGKEPKDVVHFLVNGGLPDKFLEKIHETHASVVDMEALENSFEKLQELSIIQSRDGSGAFGTVAPWWIPVVDDTILLLYVFRDGWMSGKTLSHSLEKSSIFTGRAKNMDQKDLPTVSILNRRIKALLTVWGDETRNKQMLRLNKAVFGPPKPVPQAPIAKVPPTSSTATPAPQVQPPQSVGAPIVAPPAIPPVPLLANPLYNDHPLVRTKHNRFARIVFSFGIPDTTTCRTQEEVAEKWRYFLTDPLLGLDRFSFHDLRTEVLDLEKSCRLRISTAHTHVPPHLLRQEETGWSILGGYRGNWVFSTHQYRRLLHRIELFKILRTQILVLPPMMLVDLVTKVRFHMTHIGEEQPMPKWWSSPKHDILLLQGVECYGLDEYLDDVWKLPLFVHANPSSHFPDPTWVEDIILTLAVHIRTELEEERQASELPPQQPQQVTPTSTSKSPSQSKFVDDASKSHTRENQQRNDENEPQKATQKSPMLSKPFVANSKSPLKPQVTPEPKVQQTKVTKSPQVVIVIDDD